MLYNKYDIGIGASLNWVGYWAYPEMDYIRKYATGQVIDVGANYGTFTLEFAKTATEVIAFEPQRVVWQCLVGNLALNCIENVQAVNCALGEKNGETHIPAIRYDALCDLGGVQIGHGREPVVMRTLDSFFLRPSLIKIDVEGYEDNVLLGARETLARSRPVLYIENNEKHHGGRQAELLIQLVEELGYHWVWHRPRYYNLGFGGECFGENMLCLPE